MDAFERAFCETLSFEGEYVNDPDDPGGETKFGISKRSYPDVDIAALSFEQAKDIYKRDYWDVLNLHEIRREPISSEIFDTAVNMGRRTAITIAQRALNLLGEDLAEDGIIGVKTISALNRWSVKDMKALFICLNGFQFIHYHLITESNPRLKKFARGWTKRIQQYNRVRNAECGVRNKGE